MQESTEFGNRLLKTEDDAFEHNAWDQVEMDKEMEESALKLVNIQKEQRASMEKVSCLDTNPNKFWDDFYSKNTNKFFKDRHWLEREFPELFNVSRISICEMGCGAGNTVFPFLQQNTSDDAFAYCFDYSSEAVKVVLENPLYDEKRCKAFVFDVTSNELPAEIEKGSLDVCICIFVLSAIHPRDWTQAAENIYALLKPGGLLLFRDYGRHDLAQLRFKKERLLDDNFYCRGDNTRVYFFTTDELESMFEKFQVLDIHEDKRLLINRAKKLKMYRCWIQAKFRKPLE